MEGTDLDNRQQELLECRTCLKNQEGMDRQLEKEVERKDRHVHVGEGQDGQVRGADGGRKGDGRRESGSSPATCRAHKEVQKSKDGVLWAVPS